MKKAAPMRARKLPLKKRRPLFLFRPLFIVLPSLLALGLFLAMAAISAGRLFPVGRPLNQSPEAIKPPAFQRRPIGQFSGASAEEYLTLAPSQQGKELENFLLAPDGESFAYLVRGDDGLQSVSLNGRIGPSYEAITFMIFSPDGRHFAYGAKARGRELVVVDGREGTSYDWIFPPRLFLPDGRFVYKARTGAGDLLVVDKWASPLYEQIYGLVLTPDQRRLVYFSRHGGTIWRTTVNVETSVPSLESDSAPPDF